MGWTERAITSHRGSVNAPKLLLLAGLATTTACWPFTALFKSAGDAKRMRTTNIKANDENWAKLEAAATQLGWPFVRGGSTDFRLKVTKPNAGELRIDYNREVHTIDYLCHGGIQDVQKCTAAANELFRPAFGIEVKAE